MSKTRKIEAVLWRFLVNLAAILTMVVLLFIVIYILVKGIPNLSLGLFSLHYTTDNQSLMPSLLHTIELTIMGLLLAVPLGVFAAVFMNEYAKKGSKLVALTGITSETLTGIPSIVYGLFGMLFFNSMFGISMLSGALTLAIMVLPVIMRTTEEALLAVPKKYREGSFGLGAGKLRTIFKIALPAAMPGIFSGIVLSIGRIVGETAALIYTAGTFTKAASSVFNSGRTLSVHMYLLSKEGLNTDQAYATAVVLLVIVIFINFISGRIASGVQKQHGEA